MHTSHNWPRRIHRMYPIQVVRLRTRDYLSRFVAREIRAKQTAVSKCTVYSVQ